MLAVTRRWATAGDLDALVGVINEAFAVERVFVDRDRIDAAGVLRLLSTGQFLVAEDASHAVVACVYLERRGDRGYFGLLAVAPARARMGLGRQMIDAAEAHFQATGCRAVDIRVVNLRAELPPIYRRLGYTERGTEPFEDPRQLQPCHFILMSKPI